MPAFGSSYLTHSWAPALVAVLVPVAILALVNRSALAHRFAPPSPRAIEDPVLFGVAAVVTALLVPALALGEPLLHVPVWIPATAAAVVLVATAAVRRPGILSLHLLPLPLVVFVCGLFLAVTALGRLGLTDLLAAAAGSGSGPLDLLRLAGVGTVTANLADNLPAYLALEPVAGDEHRLLALLVAVDAGPLITPWASLATLLWHARLTALDVRISWWRFAALGAIAAPLTVAAATLAVLLA
jgi:Na+/H+ antiporter NhaD/arsenite permease-like protein